MGIGQQNGPTDSTNAASDTGKKQTIAPVKTTMIVTATRSEISTDTLCELSSMEFMVVDTENSSSFVRTGSARKIAAQLGAQYFAMDKLKAENLVTLFHTKSM